MRLKALLLLMLCCLCLHLRSGAAIGNHYPGVTYTESSSNVINVQLDSMLYARKIFLRQNTIKAIDVPRFYNDKTLDFYLLLGICLILGVVVYANPRYFENLFKAFVNPSQSTAAKEQIEIAVAPNAVMNGLFVLVAGVYVFYIFNLNKIGLHSKPDKANSIFYFVAGIALMYLIKYIVLVFSGWVFRIKHISEQYTFNVFFINKLIGVLLLPIVIMLAFSDAMFFKPLIIISCCLIAILFFYRYILSYRIFETFFQYSWFHFFTYLCASEILPMAVLLKMLV
jgi:hypothetical protein